MRFSQLITFCAIAFSVILPTECSENTSKAVNTGKAFLEYMYTCDFKACDALCTENGRKEIRWFASNLTEDDLAVISRDVKIDVEDYEISGSTASIIYTAKNVIICDSLETKGHIGERSLTIKLKEINGSWKVDELEW